MAEDKMPGMRIAGIAAYAPKNVVSNDDVAERLQLAMEKANVQKLNQTGEGLTDDERDQYRTGDRWIRRFIGFGSRRFVGEGEGTIDLALKAAELLLDGTGFDRNEIDGIVFGTVTPSYLNSPPDANLLQYLLGISPQKNGRVRRIIGVDVSLACCTWVAGLTSAYSLIKSGMCQNVLLIGADAMSTTINWHDRAFATVLGDAGTATMCSTVPEEEDWFGINHFFSHMDGQHWKAIITPKGGSRSPVSSFEDIACGRNKLGMDGALVKELVVPAISDHVTNSGLKRVGWEHSDLDLVTFHEANLAQLNRPIVEAWRGKGFRGDVLDAGGNFGNTTSASIALALALNGEKLRPVATPPKKFAWVGVGGSLTAILVFGEIRHELLTFVDV